MSYALSVRDFNETTREVTIKHYRIRKLDRGGVFISPKKSFCDLLQLVDHYHSECIHWLLISVTDHGFNSSIFCSVLVMTEGKLSLKLGSRGSLTASGHHHC